MSDLVLYDVKDRVATITLNRPERRNAQNPELLDLLNDCWERAAADDEVRVIAHHRDREQRPPAVRGRFVKLREKQIRVFLG